MNRDPEVNNYVFAEFDADPKTYYFVIVTRTKDEYKILYLRRREKSGQFVFPNVPDMALVNIDDIRVLLENPIMCGTTKRQHFSPIFDYNFDYIFVK